MDENSNIHSSSYPGADMSLVILEKPSQPKVGNLGGQIPVQKDVACLNVTVYDSCLASLMQVCQAPCRPDQDLQTNLPVEFEINPLFCTTSRDSGLIYWPSDLVSQTQ